MSQQVIVIVCEKDDPKHGEITILEGPERAERLVETLLDAGFEAERIRVFGGTEKHLQISYKPVVALAGDGDDRIAPPSARDEDPRSSFTWTETNKGEPELAVSAPGTRNGERLSDMFPRRD